MDNKKITAVVVTYNRKEMLLRCIDCLWKQQGASCHILVVDNASTDGTGELVAALAGPDLRYHNTGANLGGAGGFNLGMRLAVEDGADYVWVMDDDCLPEPDALEKLMEADRILDGNYGWLSSKCVWTDGTLCPMNLQRRSPYKEIRFGETGGEMVPAQMASFVSLFLRRETILKYGLPIGAFFIWTDDWEYTRRISKAESCYVAAASKVVHAMKSKTTVNIAKDSAERLPRYWYFYRNDVYLYRREGLPGWIWVIAKDIWHMVQTLLFAPSQKGKRLRIIAEGFKAGIRFQPQADSFDQKEKEGKEK